MKLSYVTLGTTDMAATIAFYDGLFADQGVTRIAQTDRMTFWQGDGFAFAAALPFDGAQASFGNGTMIGFDAGTAERVDQIHARALALGAADEGAPGPRGPRYSSYLRDPDGNKLCIFA